MKRINVTMDDSLAQEISRISRRGNEPVSAVIRKAAAFYAEVLTQKDRDAMKTLSQIYQGASTPDIIRLLIQAKMIEITDKNRKHDKLDRIMKELELINAKIDR